MTGFSGSFLTAIGCFLGGALADRMNRWSALLYAGLVIGAAAILTSAAPRVPSVFVAAVVSYLVLSGVANAAYSALILEVVGRSARSAGAQYTWLNNLGNVPVACMIWLDGRGYRFWGSPGLFAVDGVGNVIPILFLFLVVARSGVANESDRTPLVAAAG